MYYKPVSANGQLVPLNWPIKSFSMVNRIIWPLEDNVSIWIWYLDRLYFSLGFLVFCWHHYTEMTYLYLNLNNIDELLTGVPTYMILAETHFRAFQLGRKKDDFRKLLQKFYSGIYILEHEDPEIYSNIQTKLKLSAGNTLLYYMTLFAQTTVPITLSFFGSREPLYKMEFPYDVQPWYIHMINTALSYWVGLIVASYVCGEGYVISEICLHLSYRFSLLKKQLQHASEEILERENSTRIARDMRLAVRRIVKQNVKLYAFAAEFQKEFSFRIFVWFTIAAALYCAVGYKVYTSPENSINFIVWICAKTTELTIIGEMGSTLLYMTDTVSSMYYESNWEQIIERSTDTKENVRLMKDIVIAMETSSKPVCLTGLNFFSVTLTTVVAILRAAGSYFTCLISMR